MTQKELIEKQREIVAQVQAEADAHPSNGRIAEALEVHARTLANLRGAEQNQ